MTTAKIVGAVNWVLQPDYPELSGEEDNERLVVKYIAGNDLLPSVLPEFGTTFYDYRWPFYNGFKELTLSDRSVNAMEGCLSYEVTLVYSRAPEMEEVSYRTLSMDVPIEQLTDKYKTKWNHSYIYNESIGDGRDILTYYADAVDTTIPDSLNNYVKWIKPDDPVPDGWFYVKGPTKPGVEVFKTSVPVVTVRKLSLYEDDLEEIAALDNTQQVPPKTYGYTGEWLQSDSSLSKEGRFYVLTTIYTGSKTIDDDIYA